MALFWKSDGKDQKTFNASLEIPYIFKSPLGIKSQLNIFKQDSTFQNTKTAIDLGYYFPIIPNCIWAMMQQNQMI